MLGYRNIDLNLPEKNRLRFDFESLPDGIKEALAEDCEDYLNHRHIPLHSHCMIRLAIQGP